MDSSFRRRRPIQQYSATLLAQPVTVAAICHHMAVVQPPLRIAVAGTESPNTVLRSPTDGVHLIIDVTPPISAPVDEVWTRGHWPDTKEVDVWHMPSSSSSQITAVRPAGLRGRNLEMVAYRVPQRLVLARLKFITCEVDRDECHCSLEDVAPSIALSHLGADDVAREHTRHG